MMEKESKHSISAYDKELVVCNNEGRMSSFQCYDGHNANKVKDAFQSEEARANAEEARNRELEAERDQLRAENEELKSLAMAEEMSGKIFKEKAEKLEAELATLETQRDELRLLVRELFARKGGDK